MKEKLKKIARLAKYLNIPNKSIRIDIVSNNLFEEIKKQNTSLDKEFQDSGISYRYYFDTNEIWFEYYINLGKCWGTIKADEGTLGYVIYELKRQAKEKARKQILDELSEVRVNEIMNGRTMLIEK